MRLNAISRLVAIGSVGLIGATLAISVPAASQTDKMAPLPAQRPEAVIYRDANFSGPAVAVSDSNPDLGLVWTVNSIRITAGTWQLCPQTQFRGTCRTITTSTAMLRPMAGFPVQSIRPVGWMGPGEPGSNASLRGMAAEFYPAPARNGMRVLACARGSATSACSATTADNFCVAMGYRGSARQSMETVRQRVYLADTLCTRTGY